MISEKSIQEVRDRADIVEVVGQFLSLKRRGVNYLANCPFHNEKTPSFNVNPARGIFKCFGCGKAGDSLTFVQEYEKFSFVEAVRWLAEFYHITLEETGQTQESSTNKQKEESLRILFEFAAKYFEHNLWQTDEGKAIGLNYFKERGFSHDTIQKFRLGYALDAWSAFYDHAIMNGFSPEILAHSSIISIKNEKAFDTYRGRVIFPIESNTGKVVGFGARIMKANDKAPKYLNSAENEIYNKSNILYGLCQARNAISRNDECILVEGYTDVISLNQAGVENVISSSGTSLTEGQLKLIKNLSRNLTILYDGDAAGIKAALRGIDLALSQRFTLHLVLLPEGEDPDSFVQKIGSDQFYEYISTNKKDVIDFQIDLKKEVIHNNPTEKSHLVNELAKTIAQIDKAEDFVLQQEYIRKVAGLLNVDEQGIINLVNKNLHANIQQRKKEFVRINTNEQTSIDDNANIDSVTTDDFSNENKLAVSHQSSKLKLEHAVIKMLLKYGDKQYDDEDSVLAHFFASFDNSYFSPGITLQIIDTIEALYNEQTPFHLIQRHFIQNQDSEIQTLCINLLMNDYIPNEKWETVAGIKLPNYDEQYLSEVNSIFAYFELNIIQGYIKQNLDELKKVDNSQEQILILMQTHKDLKAHERSLLNLVIKPF